jgi:hypothetical protein
MVEWWNNGFKNRSAAGGLISDLRGVSKKDFILLYPLFQPSNIPSFHGIFLRHSQLTLTWPRAPGFLNLNKALYVWATLWQAIIGSSLFGSTGPGKTLFPTPCMKFIFSQHVVR